jgi:hypothetical protein
LVPPQAQSVTKAATQSPGRTSSGVVVTEIFLFVGLVVLGFLTKK